MLTVISTLSLVNTMNKRNYTFLKKQIEPLLTFIFRPTSPSLMIYYFDTKRRKISQLPRTRLHYKIIETSSRLQIKHLK